MHVFLEEEKTTPITSVLKVIESYLKTKIISNEKDYFGIVLFNTSKANNEMNLDGVNNYLPINNPNALIIKKLKETIKNCDPNTNKDKFRKETNKVFPSNRDKKNYIHNGLWVVHTLLKNYDKKVYRRRVFLFTDNDDPLKNDSQEKSVCLQRAKDMSDSDIILEIFPMNFRDKFNLSNFYMLIIPTNGDDEGNSGRENIITIEQCIDRLNDLKKRVRQKEMKKRTISKCVFNLTTNTRIYMNIYCNLKKANKGRMLNVEAKTNHLLKSVTISKCKDNGAELYPEQIGTYLLYANRKIKFPKEDMKKVKVMEQPGLTLMGFKSIDCIKPYYNLRESYFIYPNELISKGSGKLVDALIKQMANKKKCAIVKFVGREGSSIKFCALFPQLERYDEDYFQTPPGLNMIVLPYADDIRSNTEIWKKASTLPKISDKESELAKKIIKKMNISFDCRVFENIELQKFYATLQAIALNEPTIERTEDTIQPYKEWLVKILGGLDEKYRKMIFGEEDPNKKDAKDNKKKKKGKSIVLSDDSDTDDKKKKGKKGKKKNESISLSSDSDSDDDSEISSDSDLSDDDDDDSDTDSEISSDSDLSDSDSSNLDKDKKKAAKVEKGAKGEKTPKEGEKAGAAKGAKKSKVKATNPKTRKKKKKEEISSESSDDSDLDMDKDKPKAVNDENLIKLVKNKILEKMSIEDLKGICSGKGISTKGLKRQDMLNKLQST